MAPVVSESVRIRPALSKWFVEPKQSRVAACMNSPELDMDNEANKHLQMIANRLTYVGNTLVITNVILILIFIVI